MAPVLEKAPPGIRVRCALEQLARVRTVASLQRQVVRARQNVDGVDLDCPELRRSARYRCNGPERRRGATELLRGQRDTAGFHDRQRISLSHANVLVVGGPPSRRVHYGNWRIVPARVPKLGQAITTHRFVVRLIRML